MTDPRRHPLRAVTLFLSPAADPEKWEVRSEAGGIAVEASWGEWVRLAKRIVETDALSRDLEARGDAWDQGHAAADDEKGNAINPFR